MQKDLTLCCKLFAAVAVLWIKEKSTGHYSYNIRGFLLDNGEKQTMPISAATLL